MGVNPQDLALSRVSSNGSCTTNSAASVIDVLREHIGIRKAILNTVHGYTATQTLVDTSVRGRDLRRGRAAAANIVPATTGAAIAVTRAIPRLRDRFDGVALRVPVLIGSLSSIVAVTERPTTAEEVNAVLSRSRAGKPVEWRLGHDHGPARQQRHRRRSARRDCRPVTDEGHRWRSVCGVQEGTDPTIVRAARRKSQSQDYR
jgi:glyceraldehyde 3-phosphate dehydrogenase